MTMTIAVASSNGAALLTDTRMTVREAGRIVRTEDGVPKLHEISGGWLTGTGPLSTIEAVLEELRAQAHTWDPSVVQRTLEEAAVNAPAGYETAFVAVGRSHPGAGFARYHFRPGQRPDIRPVASPRELALAVTWPPHEAISEQAFERGFAQPFARGLRPIIDRVKRSGCGLDAEMLRYLVRFFARVHASGITRTVGPEIAIGLVLPTEDLHVTMQGDELAEAIADGELELPRA